jgi:hypothetical protein
MGTDTITLAVGEVASVRALHAMLAAALGFPDYYGMNWNAFDECISDPDQSAMPRVLIVKGLEALKRRFPRDAECFRQCLEDQLRTHAFEVVFEEA